MSKPFDLCKGTLDVLLLKILTLEPMHGWAISERLKQVSGEAIDAIIFGVSAVLLAAVAAIAARKAARIDPMMALWPE